MGTDLLGVLLLPSLVPAILSLSNHLWADPPQGQRAILRVLHLILRSSAISNEASPMLSSVLNIAAKPLEHALRSYQRQDPKSQEVEPLLRVLKESLPASRRTGAADHSELESWTSTHGNGGVPGTGGLSAAVRHTVQTLIQWAQNPQNPPINGMPATYTHRQMITAHKMMGAKQLLAILVDELKANAVSPDMYGVAYDVVTAIICAPDAAQDAATAAMVGATAAAAAGGTAAAVVVPPQRRMTLREALKAEAEEWKRMQKSDPVLAETVVRLYRRVEAQMAPAPAPPAMLQPELEALDEAMAAAAAAAGEHSVDAMNLDTTGLDGAGVDLGALGGTGADLGALSSAAGSAGGLDLGGDDLFGGLSAAGDFGADFANWDSMELG